MLLCFRFLLSPCLPSTVISTSRRHAPAVHPRLASGRLTACPSPTSTAQPLSCLVGHATWISHFQMLRRRGRSLAIPRSRPSSRAWQRLAPCRCRPARTTSAVHHASNIVLIENLTPPTPNARRPWNGSNESGSRIIVRPKRSVTRAGTPAPAGCKIETASLRWLGGA